MITQNIILLQKNCGKERLEDYYATEVEQSSSLSFPRFSCSRIVSLCFHSCLVSVLFRGPSLLVVNFYRKFFTPNKFCACESLQKQLCRKPHILSPAYLSCSLHLAPQQCSLTLTFLLKFMCLSTQPTCYQKCPPWSAEQQTSLPAIFGMHSFGPFFHTHASNLSVPAYSFQEMK